MRLILQRVSRATVHVNGEEIASIGVGLLVLVGVEKKDQQEQVEAASAKIVELRIFDDTDGKMNLNIDQAGGACLVVSQFTLASSLNKGRRPSFDDAAPPVVAKPLVSALCKSLKSKGLSVRLGQFGARMEVELVNSGPATFVLNF